jgi:hypothetical protein
VPHPHREPQPKVRALLIGDISGGTGTGFCDKPGYRGHQLPGIGIQQMTEKMREYEVPGDLEAVILSVGARDVQEQRTRGEILGDVRELLSTVRSRCGEKCNVYITSIISTRGECPRELNNNIRDLCRDFKVWNIDLSKIRRGVNGKWEWHHKIGSEIRSVIEKKEMERQQGFWKRTVWRKRS